MYPSKSITTVSPSSAALSFTTFSALDFNEMTKEDIRDNFIEFNEYKEYCEYKDCMHINEKICAIKEEVNNNTILKSRYDNYLKFVEKR